jgi:DNA mismatch endonuclease (patch repair protein)
MDIVDKDTRSRMMRGIKNRDTNPELALRRALHALGLRFRVHGARQPGKPDIVSKRYSTLIYVHGCFWHRHLGCRLASVPKTRDEFWRAKFEGNVARDERVRGEALQLGWRVIIVWECALRRQSNVDLSALTIMSWLRSGGNVLEVGAQGNGIECTVD